MNGEDLIALLITGALGLCLAVMGIALLCGHGAFLIAGYNTLPKSEKEKFDKRALCRFMGKLLLAIAPCIPCMALGGIFDLLWLSVLSSAAVLVLVVWAVVYANTKNRFRR